MKEVLNDLDLLICDNLNCLNYTDVYLFNDDKTKCYLFLSTRLKYSDVTYEYVNDQYQNGDISYEALENAKKDDDLMKQIRNLNFEYIGKFEDNKIFVTEDVILLKHENKNILGAILYLSLV